MAQVRVGKDSNSVPSSTDLVTRFGYDELGRKIWQQDAEGFKKDRENGLAEDAAPVERVTRFAYDKVGRMKARQLPNGKSESMTYYPTGQVWTRTDFNGHTTTFTYDLRGRMLSKTPDAVLQQQSEAAITFSYPNEFTKVSNRGGIQTVEKYDEKRGWLSEVQSPTGTLKYGYDDAGNKTSVQKVVNGNITGILYYDYDKLSRLWRVRDAMGILAEYSYDTNGNRKTVARRNGVGTVYHYDEQNRLQSMAHAKDGVITSSFEYSLYQDGKRNQLKEQLTHPTSSSVASGARTIDYRYDEIGRLKEEVRQERQNKRDNSIAESTRLYSWTYDNANNRLTQSIQNYTGLGTAATITGSTATAYSYNVADELYEETTNSYNAAGTVTGSSTTGYEYDFNGNQVSKTIGSNTTNYAYSFEDKLLSVSDASTQHAYSYDVDGNRLSQITTTSTNTKKRYYLVDTSVAYAQVVEERDENGTVQASYTTTDNGELISGTWLNDENALDTRYYLQDGHASTRQLSDTTGGISDAYSFDGWGNSIEDVGNTSNNFLYNGQQKDDTGLYHLRARQYNPGSGRFLNHDPILGSDEEPITLHRYSYAGANPISYVDPGGKEFSLSGQLNVNAGMTALNGVMSQFQKQAFVGTISILANIVIAGNFAVDLDQHFAKGRGVVPDGVFVSFGRTLAEWSFLDGNAVGGVYVDLERFFADGEIYFFGSAEVAISPEGIGTPGIFGRGIKHSVSEGGINIGLSYNTFDPATGKTNPSRLNGYGFNATCPWGLSRVLFGNSPAYQMLTSVANRIPVPKGSVGLSVSANGMLDFEARNFTLPSFNDDGAASMYFTSTRSLASSVSYSVGFATSHNGPRTALRAMPFGSLLEVAITELQNQK